MKTWKIVACLIPITLGASIALTVQANHIGPRDGIRTVIFDRDEPCSTCGHAAPVTITCNGLDWVIYQPGSVSDVAAKVCPAGAHYTWKVQP